jgi:hypothetical protein
MRYYINHLAATSHEQGRTKNDGVGAKVAAGSRNPHGLEYRSWHQGSGALACFKRDPNGRWGLEPQDWPDGTHDFWRPLGESEKPWALRGHPHGTRWCCSASTSGTTPRRRPGASAKPGNAGSRDI